MMMGRGEIGICLCMCVLKSEGDVICRYFFLGSDGPDIHQIYTKLSDCRKKEKMLLFTQTIKLHA